ncbi:helix-turn-helix domain-containing protein [Nitratireductor basaltis]|nr:helix-turn-helix transcriptional regulator [Nitratireductor basaltis]
MAEAQSLAQFPERVHGIPLAPPAGKRKNQVGIFWGCNLIPVWYCRFIMKLKQYLETTGTSQATLADALRISQAAISRYVRGERFPDRNMILKIQRATKGKVKPRDWFEEEGEAA